MEAKPEVTHVFNDNDELVAIITTDDSTEYEIINGTNGALYTGSIKKVSKHRGVFIANPVGCKGIRIEKPVKKRKLASIQERRKNVTRETAELRRNASIVSALKPAIRRKNRKAKR